MRIHAELPYLSHSRIVYACWTSSHRYPHVTISVPYLPYSGYFRYTHEVAIELECSETYNTRHVQAQYS